ncbi:MAG: ribosome biogenesis GTPase Der [Anaerolineae bacterium]
MTRPILAIVGRPNVGKSTLFNRIVGERTAIVADAPGTTRDRLYADAEFAGHEFTLVDTGGIVGEREVAGDETAKIARLTREQAELAINGADAILFMTDAETGLAPGDFDIAEILRRAAKPVYLVVNKVDNDKRRADAVEFYQLGLGDPIPISALHGVETGDLLQLIVDAFPPPTPELETEVPQIAIVGRPNVGKSSLLNALLGQERAIVSEVPGTTRDALDTEMIWRDQPVTLIDTAGLRRRGKIEAGIEKWGSLRALKAIQRADVVLLVMDAAEGPLAGDTHIASYILEGNKGIALVVNKWDLIDKETETMDQFTERVRAQFNFVPYAPVLFVSAKTRQRIATVLDTALRVRKELRVRVSTADLNDLVREAVVQHAPPNKGKRILKFYYATQVGIIPPTFVFFVNHKELVHFSYERFLENKIRERWNLTGAPIRLIFRAHKKGDHGPGA